MANHMQYQEKLIGDELYYRIHPADEWKVVPRRVLVEAYLDLKKEMAELKEVADIVKVNYNIAHFNVPRYSNVDEIQAGDDVFVNYPIDENNVRSVPMIIGNVIATFGDHCRVRVTKDTRALTHGDECPYETTLPKSILKKI